MLTLWTGEICTDHVLAYDGLHATNEKNTLTFNN